MKNNLTIVNVAEYCFYDVPGGVARLATDLARKQVEWGHRAFFVGLQAKTEHPVREQRDGITIVRVQDQRYPSPDPRNLLNKILGFRRAVRDIARETGGVDVIHSHNPVQAMGAFSAIPAGQARRVHSIHSPWLMEIEAQKLWSGQGGWKQTIRSRTAQIMARRQEAAVFRRVDYLTSDSEYTRKEITTMYSDSVAGRPFEVLPGWVDPERFTPDGERTDWSRELGRKPRGPVVLTVRGLVQRNGLEMLLDAAAEVKRRGLDFELVIGGDGNLKQDLLRRATGLALDDRVTFLGRVTEDRLPVLYRSCAFFVLPTIALECFGLIILEAFASGKPVIATPVGAIPELMERGFPEGLLPSVSYPDLARTMAELIRKGDVSPEQKKRFMDLARGIYSQQSITQRFRGIYERRPVGLAQEKRKDQ